MKLENWYAAYIYQDGDVYKAPETMSGHLVGEVYGHPTYPDGSVVKTSGVKSLKGNILTTRSGSEYELGAVAESYAEMYPDALERLKELLSEE